MGSSVAGASLGLLSTGGVNRPEMLKSISLKRTDKLSEIIGRIGMWEILCSLTTAGQGFDPSQLCVPFYELCDP